LSWLFLLDDQLDEGPLGRDPEAVRQVVRPLAGTLGAAVGTAAGTRPGAAGGGSAGPLPAALADVWRRIAPGMPRAWRRRFAAHVTEYLRACGWEAANRARRRVPPPGEFIPARRRAGAIWPSLDLLEFVTRRPLPEIVYEDMLFTELRTAAADVVCWTDDVLTVEKERARGDVHNLALVLENATGCPPAVALDRVTVHIGLRIADFVSRARHLPGTLDALRVDEPARQAAMSHVDGLRHWMRGHLDWGLDTVRYRGAEPAGVDPAYLEALWEPC
jgi:hypothetical protein